MKSAIIPSLTAAACCLLSAACQTTTSDWKPSEAEPAPTPAAPLPAWTRPGSEPRSDQQVLITTRVIEITRPANAADIPEARYERTLTDARFQAYLRELTRSKGADLVTAPSLVARDGQSGAVEVGRELTYPLAPGEGAETATENIGVTTHIDARHIGGREISVRTLTRISELDGFSEASPGFDLPVFKRRDVDATANLKSGETLIVGGVVDETSQQIEDAGPLGLIKRRSTMELSRELVVAVTATLIDPSGAPLAAR